jgi:hypothetical protein
MKKKYTIPHGDSEKTILSDLEEMLPLIQECLSAGQSVKFSPRGISMLPMIVQGRDSVTLATPPEKLKKFDIPLYRRADGSFVLHRVVKVRDTYTCIGDNQFKAEPGVTHGSVIAVVTAFTRKGKTYSVSCAGYRLYCVLWHISRPARRVWRAFRVRAARLKRKIKS